MNDLTTDQERFELEKPEQPVTLERDRRPRMPEPLPVRILAIEDLTIPYVIGQEELLDDFYVGLLQFAKEDASTAPAYRADNLTLRFTAHGRLAPRENFRPTQIEVQSLGATEQKLIDLQWEYTRQRGLMPGQDALVLLDPAGNYVELTEARAVL